MPATTEKDILIAEDDREDVEIFESALKELNIDYRLRHAPNGDVLFVLLKEQVPYILFLDINMPCKDGTACIKEIRQHPEYDKLPIIIYTANLYHRITEECYRNGANLYITKANTFGTIVDNLRKVFAIDWEHYLHYPPLNHFVLS